MGRKRSAQAVRLLCIGGKLTAQVQRICHQRTRLLGAVIGQRCRIRCRNQKMHSILRDDMVVRPPGSHDGQIGKHGFQIHDSSSIVILVINISPFYSGCKEAPAFWGSQPVFGSVVSVWPPPTRSRSFSSAFCRSLVIFRVVHPALSAISLPGCQTLDSALESPAAGASAHAELH